MPVYGTPALTDRDIRLLALEYACERVKARFREIEVAERDAAWLLDRPDTTTIAMLRTAREDYHAAVEAFNRAFEVVREGAGVLGDPRLLQSLDLSAPLDDSGSPPVERTY